MAQKTLLFLNLLFHTLLSLATQIQTTKPDFILLTPINTTPRFEWVSYQKPPMHAIIGGSHQQYICRAQSPQGEYHAGRLPFGSKRCIIIANNKVMSRSSYQILIANGVHWVESKGGNVSPYAVTANDLLQLARYPCSTRYQDVWYPGEIAGLACAIAVDNKIILNPHYLILVTQD